LCIVYHLLPDGADDADLGGDGFERRDRDGLTRRLVHRLERLSHQVALEPQGQVA
jgi:hypothetical protein